MDPYKKRESDWLDENLLKEFKLAMRAHGQSLVVGEDVEEVKEAQDTSVEALWGTLDYALFIKDIAWAQRLHQRILEKERKEEKINEN